MDPKMLDIVDRFESAINSRDDRVHRANTSGMRPAIVSEIDQEGVAWVTVQGSSDAIPIEQVTNRLHPGDRVLISINDGVGSETGNISCPATDDTVAEQALADAAIAQEAASNAIMSAEQAESAAESAQASAGIAHTAASQATFGLSEVEKVVGTLNWISEHATYSLTQDQAVVDGKLYYTRSGSGTTQDPYVYTPVIDPQASGLSSYYEMALDKSVQNYIASHLAQTNYGLDIMVDGSTFKIHLGTVDGTHTMGTYIVDATGNVVGRFSSDGFQVGKTSESHILGDYHSFKLVDKDGMEYVHLSDLRDSSGVAEVTEQFGGTGVSTDFHVAFRINSVESVTVNEDPVSEVTYYNDLDNYVYHVYLPNAPASGATVIITYMTESGAAKAYTFGTRAAGNVGAHSFSAGYNNVSSAYSSFAEGQANRALGPQSHAEGLQTTAAGENSHSEGMGTTSNGWASHAGGYASATRDTAGNSFARGNHAVAAANEQFVVGRYNVIHTDSATAFVVGNGSSGGRSDAYYLEWDGSEYVALDTNAASGKDYDIYSALTTLGWASDVIV